MIIAEVERKFEVGPEMAQQVLDLLLEESPLGYTAGPPEHQDIVDVYYDFQDRRLTSNGHYLRFRSRYVEKVERFITLRFLRKVQNVELIDEETRPLNDEGIAHVIALLKKEYPDFQPHLNEPFVDQILKGGGMEELLRVVNHRVVRDISTPDSGNARAFRVKFDQYSYHREGKSSSGLHYELEIDFYKDRFISEVDHFVGLLNNNLKHHIREMHRSKIMAGLKYFGEL